MGNQGCVPYRGVIITNQALSVLTLKRKLLKRHQGGFAKPLGRGSSA